MKQLVMTLTLCIGLAMTADAQTFTQRLQQKSKGEGTVTVTHDKTIDDLVNRNSNTASSQSKKTYDDKPTTSTSNKKEEQKQAETKTIISRDSTEQEISTIDNRKKVMRNSYKVAGYRVQAFAGGNSRTDRQKAEQVGNNIKSHYPDVPVYTHFYSPRWICRIGNYRTYEEAHQMLLNIRKLGYSSATIVKGKITVQY